MDPNTNARPQTPENQMIPRDLWRIPGMIPGAPMSWGMWHALQRQEARNSDE